MSDEEINEATEEEPTSEESPPEEGAQEEAAPEAEEESSEEPSANAVVSGTGAQPYVDPGPEKSPLESAPDGFDHAEGWAKLKEFALKHRETPAVCGHKFVGKMLFEFIRRCESGDPV